MPSPSTFTIESLKDIELLRQCIEVQKQAWGFTEAELLPLRMLVVCTRIGGQVLGARNSDGKVVGFLNALPGLREGMVYLHSHMLGVLPQYQNLGVGRSLKWFQREEALSRGIRLIEWTFDPFEFRNAHLNLELLGAISRKYLVNTYGITSSPLHGGMPTDRFIAEWHLDSPRVVARREGRASDPLNSCRTSVEIPLHFKDLRRKDPAAALDVQLKFGETILNLFRQNFYAAGFELDPAGERARYHLLPRIPDIPDL